MAEASAEFAGAHRQPRLAGDRKEALVGLKQRMCGLRGGFVPQTRLLTRVAAEEPLAQRGEQFFGDRAAVLDRLVRQAAAAVDRPVGADRPRGAAFDTPAAVAAAVFGERAVVSVQFDRGDDRPDQASGAQTRMDEQRMPPLPAEPGLHGPPFFEYGARVDERAPFASKVV